MTKRSVLFTPFQPQPGPFFILNISLILVLNDFINKKERGPVGHL